MYEQGSGKIDLARSFDLLQERIQVAKGGGKGLKASVIPQEIDLSAAACPYAWPYCRCHIITYSHLPPATHNLPPINSHVNP